MKIGRQTGFTILELMTVITVLGILVAIALPSFSETMRNSNISSQTNAIVTALNLARSEATKRGIPVAVCAATAAFDNCSGDNTAWNKGWIVFGDKPTTTAGIIDGIDDPDPYQVWPAVTGRVTVTTTAAFVSFKPDGSLVNPPPMSPQITITVSHPECTDTHGRQITISTTGRISSVAAICP